MAHICLGGEANGIDLKCKQAIDVAKGCLANCSKTVAIFINKLQLSGQCNLAGKQNAGQDNAAGRQEDWCLLHVARMWMSTGTNEEERDMWQEPQASTQVFAHVVQMKLKFALTV